MERLTILAITVAAAVGSAACGQPAGTREAASETLGVAQLRSIQISGTGRWFQFGQAANPTLPWPQFDVSSYTATINYETPAARVQMARLQTVEAGRTRPTPVEQEPDQYLSGTSAWNIAGGAAAGAPAAVEERVMEIWTTPHGFLKAAMANNATSQPANGGSEVSFTVGGKYRYVGTIDAQNHVARVQTWIDNPVLGDTPVEFTYSDYRDFGGVMFPAHIVRTQGGHPVLDITVSSVTANAPADFPAPPEASAPAPPVNVASAQLAPGVYYLTGGSHHSVAIDQRDHIVIVEGPQLEDRSLAVIAKAKELIPNKPIRYLINTHHHHFDHSGGMRTYVDEGAAIVTHQMNRPYYEQAWAAPHTLSPDRLEQSKKAATFETFTDKHVLTDGSRSIEVHLLAGSGHHDGFALVYLPRERILIEGDAYTPAAADAPPPPAPNPYSVNLDDNIQRLKLDVRQIAALHGPRLTTLADLRTAIGRK